MNDFTLLKRIRTEKKMTQEQLAEKAGIGVRSLRAIENGEVEPRLGTVMQIAEALGLTADELTEKIWKDDFAEERKRLEDSSINEMYKAVLKEIINTDDRSKLSWALASLSGVFPYMSDSYLPFYLHWFCETLKTSKIVTNYAAETYEIGNDILSLLKEIPGTEELVRKADKALLHNEDQDARMDSMRKIITVAEKNYTAYPNCCKYIIINASILLEGADVSDENRKILLVSMIELFERFKIERDKMFRRIEEE